MHHKRLLQSALVVGGVMMLLMHVGFFAPLDERVSDAFFSPRSVSSDIVIVAIDDASLAELGQWPWDRQVFADFVTALAPHKPQALGIDVIFAEPSRFGDGSDDVRFAQAIASSDMPIVLASEASGVAIENGVVSAPTFVEPLTSFLAAGVLSAPTNLIIDNDGIARRVPLVVTNSVTNEAVQTFGHQLARVVGNSGERNGIERIAYAQPTGAVRRISFARALAEPELLANKIVLVGATAPSLHDEQQTPVDRGTVMPGVEIQAHIVDMLLRDVRLVDIPRALALLLVLCAALLSFACFVVFRRSVEPLIANAIVIVLVAFVSNMLFDSGIVVPAGSLLTTLGITTFTLFAYRYVHNRKETRVIYDAFKRYVSPPVLKEILRHPEKVVFGGEERIVTVLFCDIRSFTTLSESMSATDLVALLNRYFAVMSAEIIATGGVIDKYIGDAIMAFWGAPLDDENHATNAVRAAQGMLRALEALNKELVAEGKAPIAIGIGLASGPAVVGNIGSDERVDYTAMGDTVNTAARLEGLTKEYKQSIVVSQKTKDLIGDAFETQPLGEVKVKGKTVGVGIHGVRVH